MNLRQTMAILLARSFHERIAIDEGLISRLHLARTVGRFNCIRLVRWKFAARLMGVSIRWCVHRELRNGRRVRGGMIIGIRCIEHYAHPRIISIETRVCGAFVREAELTSERERDREEGAEGGWREWYVHWETISVTPTQRNRRQTQRGDELFSQERGIDCLQCRRTWRDSANSTIYRNDISPNPESNSGNVEIYKRPYIFPRLSVHFSPNNIVIRIIWYNYPSVAARVRKIPLWKNAIERPKSLRFSSTFYFSAGEI